MKKKDTTRCFCLVKGVLVLVDLQISGRFVYALSPGNETTPAAIAAVDSF